MKTLLPLLLLLIPLSLPPALSAEDAKPKPAPTELSDSERLEILKLQNEVNRLTAQIQGARAAILDATPKLQAVQRSLQIAGRALQQKHGALGYNLDNDLNWIADSVPTIETPNAAPQPQPVPPADGPKP